MVTKRKQKRLAKKRIKKIEDEETKNDYISNNRDKRRFN